MTRPQAQLRPRTNPLLATVCWLLALMPLLFFAACGGEEASMSENTATAMRSPTATPEPAVVTVNNCGLETVYDAEPSAWLPRTQAPLRC